MMAQLGLTRLPVAPRPQADERLSSWLIRLADLYAMPEEAFLEDLGITCCNVRELEWHLSAGQGTLIATRTGLSIEGLQALTFTEFAPQVRVMLAHKNRYICSACQPGINLKSAAFPWNFRCQIHGTRYQSPGGLRLETLFGDDRLATLDHYAGIGTDQMMAWANGEEVKPPGPDMILGFLTTQHRQPSPPSLAELPRMSLQARRDNYHFLSYPIVRQALTIVVPEYDEVAPILTKPVCSGLFALVRGSLLQAYSLAVGIGRMSENPIDYAVTVLMASDPIGEIRLRLSLKQWPPSLRRRIYARLWRVRVAQRDGEMVEKVTKKYRDWSPVSQWRYAQSRNTRCFMKCAKVQINAQPLPEVFVLIYNPFS